MRIVIGEDSALFREGLARLLADAGHEIVAKAADAQALEAAVHEQQPDLVDRRHPHATGRHRRRRTGGAPTARARTRTWRSSCSRSTSRRGTRSSWSSGGGFGYLLKDRVLDVDDFLDALPRVAAGGSALDPEVVGRLLRPRGHDSTLALLDGINCDVSAAVARRELSWLRLDPGATSRSPLTLRCATQPFDGAAATATSGKQGDKRQ